MSHVLQVQRRHGSPDPSMVSAEDMSLCDPYRELELYLEQANVSNTNNVQVILVLSDHSRLKDEVP